MIDQYEGVFLTPQELSARWKKEVSTLRNWRCQKRGPRFVKIEGSVLYPLSEVVRTERAALRGVA